MSLFNRLFERTKARHHLVLAGAGCNIDAPRTPVAAAKEEQQRGVQLVRRGEAHYIARTINGEGLPLLRNARSWRMHDGRLDEVTMERRRDAEFARIVAGARR